MTVMVTGEPLMMFTEMALLIDFRTATNSAMAAKYLAQKDSSILALIGTSMQSEFQHLTFPCIFDSKEVCYYDTDLKEVRKTHSIY